MIVRSLGLLIISAATVYKCFSLAIGWRRNIAAAKRSGLPYVVSPVSPVFLPWQITHKLWIPLIRLLPASCWERWLEIVTPDMSHHTGHKHFALNGDSFLIVSPGKLYLMTASAPFIHAVATRRESFPKWTETYELLRLFGENVLTCEGSLWRMHRKATSASFNEKNAALVFKESIRQTQGMLGLWTREGSEDGAEIEDLEKDTMRLTLNVIGYVGFGMRFLWPGEKLEEGADRKSAKYGSLEAPEGHELSFVDTMQQLLEHIFLLLVLPSWFLHMMPFKACKEAAVAHDDYSKYMDELLEEKKEATHKGSNAEEGMDLMGQMIRSAQEAQQPGSKNQGKALSREDIIGNAFIMLVAGHETTADAMHFTLIELATNPKAQRRLQKDIDELLGDKDPATWDYDTMLGPLMASMVGAVMNETLRLIPPAVEVPKQTTPHKDQQVMVDGKEYTIPKGTIVSLVVAAVQRNPNHWPTRPSKLRPGKDDLWDYEPERWFLKNDSEKSSGSGSDNEGVEDFGGYAGPDTSAQLFRPERGAYVPFSYGPRSCLGRRIAQVKLIAALAVLFREHSVELAVREEDGEDDEARYQAAQDRSRKTVDGAASVVTLKLQGGQRVPIRLVKRGKERFVNWMDN